MTTQPICTVQRNAIASSNIGIALMERHYYSQAIEVLTDSFRLLKSDLSNSIESMEANTGTFSAKHELIVESTKQHHRALQLLSERQVPHQGFSPFGIPPAVVRVIHITSTTTSVGIKNVTAPEDILMGNQLVCIMKLDPLAVSTSSIHMLCAVLLHNLAIAHLCIANVLPMKTSVSYLKKAIRLLHLSYAMQTKLGIENEIDALQDPEYFQILGIILRNLIQVLHLSGLQRQAQMYIPRLQALQKLILETELVAQKFFAGDVAAAAAA